MIIEGPKLVRRQRNETGWAFGRNRMSRFLTVRGALSKGSYKRKSFVRCTEDRAPRGFRGGGGKLRKETVMERGESMKTLGRTLVRLSLLLALAAGAMVALSGCERNKDVGERVENTAEEAGEAVERAGEKIENAV